MELEKLEAKGPGREVLFDILKEWMSASFHRQVRDTTPPGCAWQSLAMAWEDAVQGGVPLNEQYDPTALATKESNMRRWLVQVYGTLSLEAAQSVAKAKLRCQLSFFHKTRYHVDLVLKHWAWYLYCLTFPSNSFAEKDQWAKICEGPVKGAFVVRMPMDSVDLYFLARLLKRRILLLELLREPQRFGNEGPTLHLVTNGGMWAPLLSSKLWLQEKPDLTGSIVEVAASAKGLLTHIAGNSACVIGYDVKKDCHIATASTHKFPLQSVQISRIIARPEDVRDYAIDWAEAAFCGIPDKAVEFQILLHLVRQEMGRRLDDLHEELAGRCPRPRDDLDRCRPIWQPRNLCASSLPLHDVVDMVLNGNRVWTKCLVRPRPDGAHFLTCQVQDFLCLEAVLDDYTDSHQTFLAHTAFNRHAKPLSSDTICSWLVLQDFHPDQRHPRFHQLMQLHAGDTLVVTERKDGRWKGWARGRVATSTTSTSSEHLERFGDFNLVHLRPQVWIAKIERVWCPVSAHVRSTIGNTGVLPPCWPGFTTVYQQITSYIVRHRHTSFIIFRWPYSVMSCAIPGKFVVRSISAWWCPCTMTT